MNFSMLTSFQLFRFQYSGICGKEMYLARFENRMKYYKRVNRYTLFEITFVYLPVVAGSAYNLFYTWYGRQVFWIDIECIVMCFIMFALKIFIIFRTQGEYIRTNFDAEDYVEEPDGAKRYYGADQAKIIADEVVTKGFKLGQFRRKVADLDAEQRKSTMRAIFDRLFAHKEARTADDNFKVKHGRGLELNEDLYVPNDRHGQLAYAAAGVAIVKNYNSELPRPGKKGTAGKKMAMYSSVSAEQRRKAEIEEERANLEYQKFKGHDMSATMENQDGTLGMTQPMDTLMQEGTNSTPRSKLLKAQSRAYNALGQNTTQMDDANLNPYDMDNDGQALEKMSDPMRSLRLKDEKPQLGNAAGKGTRSEDEDDALGIDKEIYNFSSAP